MAFAGNLTGDAGTEVPLYLAEKKVSEPGGPVKVVLFPGAGHAFRRWPASSFALLMEHIVQRNRNSVFTIAGGPTDTILAKEIIDLTPIDASVISDLTGKTSLTEMVQLLQQADLLVSNETSSVHMAAAVNLNTVCISNGNQFGRFNPYPKVLNKPVETVYPNEAFSDPALFHQHVEQNKIRSEADISTVSVQKVFDAVCKFIPEDAGN
jgi:ADP-heptose:LPS heptosyltransferase